jgi:hypothetical protein
MGGRIMSTRCQIGMYEYDNNKLSEWDALIYKHSDGYPEGIIPLIIPILADFEKNRGLDDIEYASSWLVYGLKKEQVENGSNPYLQIGICKDFHDDIAYYYAVRCESKIIDVYDVGNPYDFMTWTLIESYNIIDHKPNGHV